MRGKLRSPERADIGFGAQCQPSRVVVSSLEQADGDQELLHVGQVAEIAPGLLLDRASRWWAVFTWM